MGIKFRQEVELEKVQQKKAIIAKTKYGTMLKSITSKSDTYGALASSICFIHCIITPFIFIAQACSSTCCEGAPLWWKSIDYIFLVISFFAVKSSTKNSNISIIKYALWLSWAVLCLSLLNYLVKVFPPNELVKNASALSLVVLHVYNLKFCRCTSDSCCAV